MYAVILLSLVGGAAALCFTGIRGRSSRKLASGLALLGLTIGFFALLSFWGEVAWFDAVGYSGRLWTEVLARTVCVLSGAVASGALVWIVTFRAPRRLRGVAAMAAAAAGALWGNGTWQLLLLFLHRVPAGVKEPMLGLDAGFYLFVLPLLDRIVLLALLIGAAAAATGLATELALDRGRRPTAAGGVRGDAGPLLAASATLGIVAAAAMGLGVFHLLFSQWGVVAGPGWTDTHVRLWAFVLMIPVALLAGLAPLFPAARRFINGLAPRHLGGATALATVGRSWLGGGLIALLLLAAIPGLLQWLVVEPNEITYEKPYIANNIALTRTAFGLGRLEERRFPAGETLDPATVEANAPILDEVRLWDWRALESVYKQFQEIRLYYEFADVDVDRYRFGGRYRQVMVSAREMQPDNLPAQSQTFVNRRFKYTHGNGVTLSTVSDFTPQGLPNLLVKDIPPVAAYPELEVARPQIYYGEVTTDPVVANSSEAEFDYPSGEENVEIHYPGHGGVELTNLWRKFVFGWKLDGTRLLLSSYPRPDSRVMFHREIRDRISTIAPFLTLDRDPYVVLASGKLYFIVDAYTTSRTFPYSQPYSSRERITFKEGDVRRSIVSRTAPELDGANYVRNAVKVVVDAFDGSVDLYVFTPEDPIIRAWQGVYPGLFKPREAMPESLRAHVRYPEDLLLAQGLTYASYHMTDPEVFYNQEDLWVRATEKYYSAVQPVEPYYVMWHPAGSEPPQFTLILPFTPKNRQVLIGWIAGLCDEPHYGELLAYKFPKEKRVLGPQQVETKIDQDPVLSGQLTLWDQRGSRVIRGNVLAIPIADTLLYVEPIYLQAETAAYPELRLVVVMHGDDMAYGQRLGEALGSLLAGVRSPALGGAATTGTLPGTASSLAAQANDAFAAYLDLQGKGRFEDAARELSRLRDVLKQMLAESPAEPIPVMPSPPPAAR